MNITTDQTITPSARERPGRLLRLLRTPVGAEFVAHQARWGEMASGINLVAEIQRSGLTGRGGAAFPAARKLAALEAPPELIVGNASEGEPLSAKDSTLLRKAPHLVLDGLRALGDSLAPRARLVLVTHPRSLAAAREAIEGRPDRKRFRLLAQRDAFVAGEASAVVSMARGGQGLPTDRRYRLTSAANKRGPALLFNAESLAHIALIARFGGEWFRAAGVLTDPGTRLFTVATEHGPHRVLELPGGATLRTVLTEAGIPPNSVTAALVGGYHGQWVAPDAFDRPLTTGREPGSLAAGAGVVLALQGGACPIHVTADIVSYLAGQSARQCGPCTAGLPRLSLATQALARGEQGAVNRIEQQAELVLGRGACHHPDGTVRLARSATRVFSAEVAAHQAGVCHLGSAV